MPGGTIQIPAYQTSLQALHVTPTVSDNPCGAPCIRIEERGSARSGYITYAAPLHVARGAEIVDGRGGEPQRGRSAQPYQTAYQYLSDNVPSVRASAVIIRRTPGSDSKANPPLRNYHFRFCDPFTQPHGFPPPTASFTAGLSFSCGLQVLSQRR